MLFFAWTSIYRPYISIASRRAAGIGATSARVALLSFSRTCSKTFSFRIGFARRSIRSFFAGSFKKCFSHICFFSFGRSLSHTTSFFAPRCFYGCVGYRYFAWYKKFISRCSVCFKKIKNPLTLLVSGCEHFFHFLFCGKNTFWNFYLNNISFFCVLS